MVPFSFDLVYFFEKVDDKLCKESYVVSRKKQTYKIFYDKILGSVPVTPQIDCCKNSGRGDTTFVQSKYFTVYKWDVHEQLGLEQDKPFMLVSVIVEEGAIGGGRRGGMVDLQKRPFYPFVFKSKGTYK
jgi:mannose-6-phosphate isomerase class I